VPRRKLHPSSFVHERSRVVVVPVVRCTHVQSRRARTRSVRDIGRRGGNWGGTKKEFNIAKVRWLYTRGKADRILATLWPFFSFFFFLFSFFFFLFAFGPFSNFLTCRLLSARLLEPRQTDSMDRDSGVNPRILPGNHYVQYALPGAYPSARGTVLSFLFFFLSLLFSAAGCGAGRVS
jgi:hypothetical protein